MHRLFILISSSFSFSSTFLTLMISEVIICTGPSSSSCFLSPFHFHLRLLLIHSFLPFLQAKIIFCLSSFTFLFLSCRSSSPSRFHLLFLYFHLRSSCSSQLICSFTVHISFDFLLVSAVQEIAILLSLFISSSIKKSEHIFYNIQQPCLTTRIRSMKKKT